jgi:hypothetical protein
MSVNFNRPASNAADTSAAPVSSSLLVPRFKFPFFIMFIGNTTSISGWLNAYVDIISQTHLWSLAHAAARGRARCARRLVVSLLQF